MLTPLLGKHTCLWGLGVTWDSYDCSAGTGTVSIPDYQLGSSTQLGCLNCGNVAIWGLRWPRSLARRLPASSKRRARMRRL